ncbi:MAG TPA: diaminopimelate epimerase, partial [bacterium]|nr:diaminopimelate epimerase [bacterium]
FLENSNVADFKMTLYQPDGSEAEMCGNGARCIARYAYLNGIANKEMKFETLAGIIEARIINDEVAVKLTAPNDLRLDKKIKIEELNLEFNYSFINTGVPHTVIYIDDLEKFDVKKIGNKIRFHKVFAPAGTNVNFIRKNNDNTISIRTYERGVEDETLACGTGSVASALITALKYNLTAPIIVKTKSGINLTIHFDTEKLKAQDFENLNLFLQGDAVKVFDGILEL